MEPLVVHTKRFHQALLADLAGLLAQLATLLATGTIDPALVVASFAIGQLVRAVGIWTLLARPGRCPGAGRPIIIWPRPFRSC